MQKMSEKEAIKYLESIRDAMCDSLTQQQAKKSIDIAIQALEEVQQYLALGISPQGIKDSRYFEAEEMKEAIDRMAGVINDNELLAQYRATGMTADQIKEMQIDYCAKGAVLEEYKAIGTVEELRADKAQMMLKKYGSFSEMIDAVAEYSVIGTVEKCREAVEKQRAREPRLDGDGYAPDGTFVWDEWLCPNCNERYEVDFDEYDYCPNCGQHILWKKEAEAALEKMKGEEHE